MNKVVAGIDIGGTKIAVALETLNGERVAAHRLPTNTETDAYATVERVSQTLAAMLEENKVELVSVGIGCPSPLDIENGLVLSPSNLRGWNKFPVIKFVRERFRVPVILDNDANTAALGEYVHGAGRRGYRNILYITVSTGLGGGIVIGGEILHGVTAGAGELGHTIAQPNGVRCNCGSNGCLETICAGVHIARRTRERLAGGEPSLMREMVADIGEISAETLVEAVRRNDKLAVEIWDETWPLSGNRHCQFHYAAYAGSRRHRRRQPEICFLLACESCFQRFVSMIPASKINIVPAALGTESGVCGALVLAKKAYSKSSQNYAV